VAKAGVLSLTRSLAVQLAPYRIRVNSVSPNKVGSPVGQDAGPADRGRSNLVGRSAVPGDIAAAVAFLVSDGAGFITAQDLVVDGGALYAQPLD
jgi:3-oxoacyl-[acyl-carrier protein] reductase